MRKLAGNLFTLCSAASLLLCAAVCVLWARSGGPGGFAWYFAPVQPPAAEATAVPVSGGPWVYQHSVGVRDGRVTVRRLHIPARNAHAPGRGRPAFDAGDIVKEGRALLYPNAKRFAGFAYLAKPREGESASEDLSAHAPVAAPTRDRPSLMHRNRTIDRVLAGPPAFDAPDPSEGGGRPVRNWWSAGWRVATAPLWAPAALLAVLPAARIAAWCRHRRPARRARRVGTCARCGYDLRASPGRCPECGAIPDPE